VGIFDQLRKVFQKSPKNEALESASESIQSDLKRSKSGFEALQSEENLSNNEEEYQSLEQNTPFPSNPQELVHSKSYLPTSRQQLSNPIELQKESLQLGVAAGYTGRTIKDIELSLARVESQMITKDWLLSNLRFKAPELMQLLDEIKETLQKHDYVTSQRFTSIESALNRISFNAQGAPEPIKSAIENEIESIRMTLPPSSKMKQLVSVVKETREISYDDLEKRLNLTRSALRGLLANTMKRSDEVERFSIDNKGWVRYKQTKSENLPLQPLA
jgi:hypothetical protein